MAKKIYKKSDLYEFVQVESLITCSNCGKETGYPSDDGEGYFFSSGWRATKGNVYCPECAKKKLKL